LDWDTFFPEELDLDDLEDWAYDIPEEIEEWDMPDLDEWEEDLEDEWNFEMPSIDNWDWDISARDYGLRTSVYTALMIASLAVLNA